jgi:hypothetical protein
MNIYQLGNKEIIEALQMHESHWNLLQSGQSGFWSLVYLDRLYA